MGPVWHDQLCLVSTFCKDLHAAVQQHAWPKLGRLLSPLSPPWLLLRACGQMEEVGQLPGNPDRLVVDPASLPIPAVPSSAAGRLQIPRPAYLRCAPATEPATCVSPPQKRCPWLLVMHASKAGTAPRYRSAAECWPSTECTVKHRSQGSLPQR